LLTVTVPLVLSQKADTLKSVQFKYLEYKKAGGKFTPKRFYDIYSKTKFVKFNQTSIKNICELGHELQSKAQEVDPLG
jgi:hypothetical protein